LPITEAGFPAPDRSRVSGYESKDSLLTQRELKEANLGNLPKPSGRQAKMAFGKTDAHLKMEREHREQEAADRADFAAFAEVATEIGLDAPSYLTTTRKHALRTIRATYGPKAWGKAVANMRRSKFIAGRNNKGWKLTLDAMLKEDMFVKLLENVFGDNEQTDKKVVDLDAQKRVEPRVWRIRLKSWNDGGRVTWVELYGPAPGMPGCVVPADILAEFEGSEVPPVTVPQESV
jgi:hypothetical protein